MDSATTITKQFSTAFNSKNESHVKWFKSLHDATQNEKSVDKVLAVNPFGINPTKKDMLEWALANNARLFFTHDKDIAMAYVAKDKSGKFIITKEIHDFTKLLEKTTS